jgi:polysaccharide chain length determinant protein (PEP-CTERM system associated)
VEETTLDLKDIIRIVRKRRKIILYTFLCLVIITAIISFIIPPTYEAETNIRIKQPKGLADSLLGNLPVGNAAGTKQLMSTYAEILKSRTVVQSVIDSTQANKEKIPTYEQMLLRISTLPVKDTEILEVKVQAETPEEAQLVANTLIDTFIERLTTLVRSEQRIVREFIGERLKESQKELIASENAMEQYKREQKIIAPTEEIKAMVERVTAVAKQASENEITMAMANAKLGGLNQQLSAQKAGVIADNLLIQQYKSKLAELAIEKAALQQNYTDKHPKVLANRAALEETRNKLSEEIAKVLRTDAPSNNPIQQALLQGRIQAEVEVAVAGAQKQALDRLQAEGEKELSKLPAKEQGFIRVMRDANVAQEIYIMLAKRHEEARISEVMEPTDIQIIDRAIPPEEPIKPRKALNIIIAGILGLFLGTGAAFALEYINKTIRDAEDVQLYLDLPVLGSIPDFDSNTEAPKNTTLFGRLKDKFVKTCQKNHHG